MQVNKTNIVLIGMPSSGKSTIGKAFAKDSELSFIDTDTVIIEKENRQLRDIVNTDGLEAFLKIQEDNILELKLDNHVIATGGSVVYSENSMNHLKNNGVVIYLELELNEIEERIVSGRRFARSKEQSFENLYNERVPLYMKYADITVNCSNKSVEDIVQEIKMRVNEA